MDKNLVIVFVKEPKKGLVKTRLAKTIGDDITLDIYKLFVKDIINTLKDTNIDFKLCGYPTLNLINESFGDFDNFLQVDGDLGVKMCGAFKEQFTKGYKKIVLIGSDTPHIPKEFYSEAFDALESNDIVLGPSKDGGYYLIAFNRSTFYKGVFEDITWSTDKVLKQTLQKLNNKAVHLLKELNDIDDITDLNAFFEEYKENYFKDSFTMEFLKGDQSWKNMM
jgi:rSAM/selenodomain-associated transferase 1